jgi:hypothetical protein
VNECVDYLKLGEFLEECKRLGEIISGFRNASAFIEKRIVPFKTSCYTHDMKKIKGS